MIDAVHGIALKAIRRLLFQPGLSGYRFLFHELHIEWVWVWGLTYDPCTWDWTICRDIGGRYMYLILARLSQNLSQTTSTSRSVHLRPPTTTGT
jgi:hypothetical protein